MYRVSRGMFAVRIGKRNDSHAGCGFFERVSGPEAKMWKCRRGAGGQRRHEERHAMEDPQRRLWQMTWPQPRPRDGQSVSDRGSKRMRRSERAWPVRLRRGKGTTFSQGLSIGVTHAHAASQPSMDLQS